ncbi:TatD family hydrolase [Spiroplasma eriocheiris]|uniref:Mg-dependent DNase n=1 Tax=Spiroplasma eriocheiris TaxID=315358 RepID=A0A0H3XMD6_9MOLU|nr:TatD family hydrolase [Spiroplasma eriocheiris]AHF58344.1 putative deoxyribonuclease [Spiroplasma eriocheiris CCTCC M 207170]AKM54779.1 Mg-dependent DNase [Spiroplasma eriocheiris]
MAGIFDTHCHLMSEEYNVDETSETIEEARISGVVLLNNVGYDIESSEAAVRQALQYDSVYATVGIHPTDVARHSSADIQRLNELSNASKVIAIGEIGLDYYHKNVSPELQKEWFRKQIKIAKAHDLPVVIHCRDAYEDCFKILLEEKVTKGEMHCYGGDIVMAQKFLDLGFYISFAGNITFKNAENLREVARLIPLNKLLVETDAPYLTPDPYRGEKNYPRFITYTVKKLAELKKIPVEEMIRVTSRNGKKVFGIQE